MLLMNKDIPVMELKENGTCTVYAYDLLPLTLRKKNVNIEDFLFDWVEFHSLPVIRSNAKNPER